jgi:uncharacterized iron-regulated membrane protein
MERLAAPWVSVEALEKSDREFLTDLVLLCRRLNRRLGVRRRQVRFRRVAALVLIALIAAGVVMVVQRDDGLLSLLQTWARGKALELRWAVTRLDFGLWLGAFAILMTALGIYLVSRTARS